MEVLLWRTKDSIHANSIYYVVYHLSFWQWECCRRVEGCANRRLTSWRMKIMRRTLIFYSYTPGKRYGDDFRWKGPLRFAPDQVITQTLRSFAVIIPSVEEGVQGIMRDNLESRKYSLSLQRRHDSLRIDTFFSMIRPIPGFSCWYCYKKSWLDIVKLRTQTQDNMHHRNPLEIPTAVHTDNAAKFRSYDWTMK